MSTSGVQISSIPCPRSFVAGGGFDDRDFAPRRVIAGVETVSVDRAVRELFDVDPNLGVPEVELVVLLAFVKSTVVRGAVGHQQGNGADCSAGQDPGSGGASDESDRKSVV